MRFRSILLASALVPTLALVQPGAAYAQENELASLRSAAASHDAQAQLRLGRGLRRAGHYDEAVRVLFAAARGATRTEALQEVARVRYDQGNFRASQTACNVMPAGHNPRDPAGLARHVCLARAHLVWMRAALAEREITAAQRIDPENGELKLVIADTYRTQQQVPQAEEAYRAAAAALPGRDEPALGLAQLYEAAQRFDDALAQYRHAIEVDPHDPQANLLLGRFLLRRRHDTAGALPVLRHAVETRPGWPEAEVALGDAMLASGDATSALATFQQAAQVAPAQAGAQSGVGRAQLALGHLPEAEPALRLAVQQVANDAEAHVGLAEVLSRTNRGDDALEEWNRAIDLLTGDPHPRMRAAEVAHGMGQNTLARAYLDRVLSDDAHYGPALLLRADIAYEENDRANARTLYAAALAGHGTIDPAHARSRIAEIDAPQARQRRR